VNSTNLHDILFFTLLKLRLQLPPLLLLLLLLPVQ